MKTAAPPTASAGRCSTTPSRRSIPTSNSSPIIGRAGIPQQPSPTSWTSIITTRPSGSCANADQYDNYDRNGPKVFVGEYAVTRNCGLGNLRGAIGEAAFMTGMERNSDVVVMASYAPLFVNVNHRAWNPDLINFDSSKWYGIAELLRPEDVRRKSRRRYAADRRQSPGISRTAGPPAA